ncbi:hypothetical protein ABPG75_002669 [Micractinium tetrahymenae]
MSLELDRRPPLFAPPLSSSQDHSRVDLEGLEAENDRSIAALSERVGALRSITSGIHGEVESQQRLLDKMALSMGGVRLSLRATADKMAKVMTKPHNRRVIYLAGGAVVLLFLFYLWLKR